MTGFSWGRPWQIVEEAGLVRMDRWVSYKTDDHPALWRRVADLEQEPDGWLVALRQYGPPDYIADDVPRDRMRERWGSTIGDLSTLARSWSQGPDGIFELLTPIVFSEADKVLCSNLKAVVADGSVKLAVVQLDLFPEATSLVGNLWLSAREAVAREHRFRRCERCRGWMRIQRSDARFCSASCRNAPK